MMDDPLFNVVDGITNYGVNYLHNLVFPKNDSFVQNGDNNTKLSFWNRLKSKFIKLQ